MDFNVGMPNPNTSSLDDVLSRPGSFVPGNWGMADQFGITGGIPGTRPTMQPLYNQPTQGFNPLTGRIDAGPTSRVLGGSRFPSSLTQLSPMGQAYTRPANALGTPTMFTQHVGSGDLVSMAGTPGGISNAWTAGTNLSQSAGR